MKMLGLAAAGLIALAGLAPGIAAPAAAQRTVVVERTTVRHVGPDRRYRWRSVCRNEWRHGHRVRICRRVRDRY